MMQVRIWEPRLLPQDQPVGPDLHDRQYVRHIFMVPPGDELRIVNITWDTTPDGDTVVDIETENVTRDRAHLGTGDADPGPQPQ